METLTRTDTKWQIVDVINITFYVAKPQNVALGALINLPDYFKFNSGLVNFSAEDHLCFFNVWRSLREQILVTVKRLQNNCIMISSYNNCIIKN